MDNNRLEHGDSLEYSADRYTQPDDAVAEPPRRLRATLRYLGPSVVISGAIVGSGEIILTASLGAAVGFSMLWWVLFSSGQYRATVVLFASSQANTTTCAVCDPDQERR